jgi:hypothetical protein
MVQDHKDTGKCVAGSSINKASGGASSGIHSEQYHTSAYPELAFWNNNLTYGSALGLKNMPNDATAILNKARGLVTDEVIRCLAKEGEFPDH